MDEQILRESCTEQEPVWKKAPIDFDSVEDIIVKFAFLSAINHETKIPEDLAAALSIDMKEMTTYCEEICDRISDPIKLLYVWKIIERDNIHRDEENSFDAANDKKSKVYDYNKTVEELASQDISKRNMTYSQSLNKPVLKVYHTSTRAMQRKRQMLGNSDERQSVTQTEEDKDRSFDQKSIGPKKEQTCLDKSSRINKR